MAQSGQSAGQDVVVVGAGVIGLACAYALCRDGVRPLVIDASEPGTGASWGNGGLIAFAPQIVGPVPGPDVLLQSVLWLLQPRSPLRLVPRPAFEYARWIGAFISSCSAEAAAAGLHATLAFNAKTAELFDGLVRDGLEFEMDTAGVLVVYQNKRAFNTARKRLAEGDGGVALSANEALDAEPLLRESACAGAIRYAGERQVRPDALTRALVDRLTQKGVEIRSGCRCTGLLRTGTRITELQTPTGTIQANAFILATGSEVTALARKAGARIPVEAGRGYSFDLPHDELPLRASVYLHEARMTLIPFRDVTRVVGMMELGARTATVRPAAIRAMNHVGARAFTAWPTALPASSWAGLRPMTPDGLPVIGRADGLSNLYLAGGHGMLGVTLSLRTGEAISSYVRGGGSDPLLEPFSPSRFTRRKIAGYQPPVSPSPSSPALNTVVSSDAGRAPLSEEQI